MTMIVITLPIAGFLIPLKLNADGEVLIISIIVTISISCIILKFVFREPKTMTFKCNICGTVFTRRRDEEVYTSTGRVRSGIGFIATCPRCQCGDVTVLKNK